MQKTLVCLSLGLLTLSFSLLIPSSAYAGPGVGGGGGAGASPPSSCDPQFMEALRARAYMETQRETVTNSATIWKPDSVMQLTCFDRQIGLIMRSGGSGFSEREKPTDTIDSNTGKPETPFDKYILANTGKLIQNQVGGSFYKELGGGNSNISGLTYNTAGFNSAGEYEQSAGLPCDNMQKLWQASKCMNIDPDKAFVPLPLYAKGKDDQNKPLLDPRNSGVHNSITAQSGKVGCDDYDLAQLSQAGTLLNTPGVGSSGFAPASLFSSVTAPYSQLKDKNGAQLKCFPGIKTGVKLGSSGGGVDEVVCPNPGCIPDNGTCKPQS